MNTRALLVTSLAACLSGCGLLPMSRPRARAVDPGKPSATLALEYFEVEDEQRLYFEARVVGARLPSLPSGLGSDPDLVGSYPLWLRVKGPDGTTAAAPLRGDQLVECRGKESTDDCFVKLASIVAGTYRVTVEYHGAELTHADLAIVPELRVDGKQRYVVDPEVRRGHVVVESNYKVSAWIEQTTLDPVSLITFVWLVDDRVIDSNDGVAKGPLLAFLGPVTKVVQVAGGMPMGGIDGRRLTLVLFRDGTERLGQWRVDALGRARPLPSISPAAAASALRAAQGHRATLARIEYAEETAPPQLVCALMDDEALRAAYAEYVSHGNIEAWAEVDFVEHSDRAAHDATLTGKERAEMRKRAKEDKERAAGSNDYRGQLLPRLRAAARRQRPDCLAKRPH